MFHEIVLDFKKGHMSRVMRKLDFPLCENKGVDQLRSNSNCEADQHLCFRYTDSTIPPLLIPQISRFKLSSESVQAVSDLVGNPEDQFTHTTAHITCDYQLPRNSKGDQFLCLAT